MSSVIARICRAFLSILSFKGLQSRSSMRFPRAKKLHAIKKFSAANTNEKPAASTHFFQTLKVTALSFFFALAIFSAAPQPAHAAEPFANGEGTFDCLGSFDWGCRVVGYLFEGKSLPTYDTGSTENGSTLANDDGGTQNTDSTSVQSALKKMMGFFSNAMLIIASLILLYHLIVMVAETAHTGTIGGKETNQLWAPIRLVIAIGLLVPLSNSDGLNSGQYIILQIAKWGAGLGSQTWKAFTEAFADKQTLVPSLTPSVQDAVSAAFNNYICMESVNYFADKIPGVKKVTESALTPSGPEEKKIIFYEGSSTGDAVCGMITFHYPATYSGNSNAQNVNRLIFANNSAFVNFLPTIRNKARDVVKQYFIPDVRSTTAPPSRTILNSLVKDFQEQLTQQTRPLSMEIAGTEYQKITDSIKRAADSYGWMSAGTWFMAITRAQGEIISDGIDMPTVGPPTADRLDNSSKQLYIDVMTWAQNSPADLSNVGAPTLNSSGEGPDNPLGPTITTFLREDGGPFVTQTLGLDYDGYVERYIELITSKPRAAATTILKYVNDSAAANGIWQSAGAWDAVQSKGINIGNVNPMADLTGLGHRHIQAAIDLWGMAIVVAGAGIGSDLALRFVSNAMGSLMGTIGLTAAIFFVSFATFALIAGVVLAFLIPLMPFVRFFYAIITWAAAIIEAMICLPLLAFAHLNPKGEGFTGTKPQFGYRMIFQIFLRPALTVFGLIGSLLIFYVAVRFLNAMYYQTVLGVANFGNGPASFLARVIFNVFYVALMYISATMSFKMIDHIPRRALQWMGDGAQEEHYQDEQGTLGAVSTQVQSQITSDLIRAPTELGGRLRLR